MTFDFLYNFFLTYFLFYEELRERELINNVHWSLPVILDRFWWNLNFLDRCQMSNFMKIRPVGAELFYADGWINMTKLIVVFCNFANAPKNFWHQAQDVSYHNKL